MKRASRVLSSSLFWFFLVLISYIALVSYDLLYIQYAQRMWWKEFYGTASVFLTGGLISFLFYFLVVYIPEYRKRRMIKANLKEWYSAVKEGILYQVIFASQKGGRLDLSADSDTVDRLSTIDGFRAAFEGGREGHEGFYAFRNYISGDDTPEYREIILNLQILSKQINYVLHSYPISDRELFDFLKRLEAFLFRLEKIGPGYAEEKVLSQFMWEIFGGRSWVKGNRGYDIVEKMIAGI